MVELAAQQHLEAVFRQQHVSILGEHREEQPHQEAADRLCRMAACLQSARYGGKQVGDLARDARRLGRGIEAFRIGPDRGEACAASGSRRSSSMMRRVSRDQDGPGAHKSNLMQAERQLFGQSAMALPTGPGECPGQAQRRSIAAEGEQQACHGSNQGDRPAYVQMGCSGSLDAQINVVYVGRESGHPSAMMLPVTVRSNTLELLPTVQVPLLP